MGKLTGVIENYRYIDKASWAIMDDIDHEELILPYKEKQEELGISVLAFHSIWNQQNLPLAQSLIQSLLESNEKSLHPFYYFLKSKAHHVNKEYHLSLSFLEEAEAGLSSTINGNAEYRSLLTCIGSLNDTDPKGIEFIVMQAIIANDKGNNYYALELYDKAIKEFTYALHLHMESYPTLCHANIAYNRRCMGKSYEAKGLFCEAMEQYKEANAIAKAIYQDEFHPEVLEITKALEGQSINL